MKSGEQNHLNTQPPSTGVPRDIHDIICIYCAGKGSADSVVMQKLDEAIHQQEQPHKFTVKMLCPVTSS